MYLIYGAGKKGNELLKLCIENKIEKIELTDSNACLWGKKINGFVVENPNEINYDEINLVIISTGYDDYIEIKKFLSSKISIEKIAYYENICYYGESF